MNTGKLKFVFFLSLFLSTALFLNAQKKAKPSPEEILKILKEGNERFVSGKTVHPNINAERLALAGKENQKDHAIATVLTCSDSRVPVELIFDSGVMDIFVIRVAGNVVKTDEAGSIEYGIAHVDTPVLVILGHTQCGAVTAATNALEGHGHKLERNIPPLVAPIFPAVKEAEKKHPGKHGKELIPFAIELNVWQAIEDLFMKSPAARKLVKEGKVKLVGAIYDVATGKIKWLPGEKVKDILKKAEASPKAAQDIYAQ